MNGSAKQVYDRRMDRTQDEAKLEKRRRRANMRRLLWSWGNTLARIQRLEQERAAFRAMADDARMTLRSPSLSGMPGGGARTDLARRFSYNIYNAQISNQIFMQFTNRQSSHNVVYYNHNKGKR